MLSKVLNYLLVHVRALRHEIRPVCFDKDRTIFVDSAEGLLRRNGQTIAIYSVKPARATIRHVTPNPDKITLYSSGGHRGRSIFYYKTDVEHVCLSVADNIIAWNRDDIPALRKAIRRFTRTARPDLTRKPGKPFTEYPEPP